MVATIVCIALALALSYLIRRVLKPMSNRWNRIAELVLGYVQMPESAELMVQRFIKAAGLYGLVTPGNRGDDEGQDFYESDDGTVHLTKETAKSQALVHGFIAAHEVGHGVVDHSSRIIKFFADYSAYAQTPKFTRLCLVALVVTACVWQAVIPLVMLALLVQVVAALIILVVEARATHYGTLLVTNSFEIPENVLREMRRCGRFALFTHADHAVWPAALLLTACPLTAYSLSPLLVIPVLAVVIYALLLAQCSWYRTTA
jgi:Zn-dependent membrane protease YugP